MYLAARTDLLDGLTLGDMASYQGRTALRNSIEGAVCGSTHVVNPLGDEGKLKHSRPVPPPKLLWVLAVKAKDLSFRTQELMKCSSSLGKMHFGGVWQIAHYMARRVTKHELTLSGADSYVFILRNNSSTLSVERSHLNDICLDW